MASPERHARHKLWLPEKIPTLTDEINVSTRKTSRIIIVMEDINRDPIVHTWTYKNNHLA
jgi:hypothetical protein